jgi:hypothetical protein
MYRQNRSSAYAPYEPYGEHVSARNEEAYIWQSVVYGPSQSVPANLMPGYMNVSSDLLLIIKALALTSRLQPQTASTQSNGSFQRSDRDIMHQTESYMSDDFLNCLPTSDVGARPPWRLDPFLGTWPHHRRDENEVAERARLTESELIVYDYRKQEERARAFGDDDDFIPWLFPPLGPKQGTASPTVMGAQKEPSSSFPALPDVCRDRTSNAVPVRQPGDSTAFILPREASASNGRLSKAIPIVRPNDGTIVTPPLLNWTASSVTTAPRASLGQAERQGQPTRTVRPALQVRDEVSTSRRATEPRGRQEASDGGDSTSRVSRASTPTQISIPNIEAGKGHGRPRLVYAESRSSRV